MIEWNQAWMGWVETVMDGWAKRLMDRHSYMHRNRKKNKLLDDWRHGDVMRVHIQMMTDEYMDTACLWKHVRLKDMLAAFDECIHACGNKRKRDMHGELPDWYTPFLHSSPSAWQQGLHSQHLQARGRPRVWFRQCMHIFNYYKFHCHMLLRKMQHEGHTQYADIGL